MLENILTNVFGRSKSKTSSNSVRNPQDMGSASSTQNPAVPEMTGPFSVQMPQPPSLPYPPPAPYPPYSSNQNAAMYPALPFSQPALPVAGGQQADGWPNSQYSTIGHSNHYSPLDSVPFEARFSSSKSSNLSSLDQLFKELRQTIDKVDRADTYLRSKGSDYDFKVEQGLIYQ